MTRPADYTPVIPGTQGWDDSMLPRPLAEAEESLRPAYVKPAPAGLEERMDHLEKMNALLWKAIHDLKEKAGVP